MRQSMTRRRLWQFALDLACDWLLIVLAGDLIYLYYAGTWTDPFTWVLGLELIVLWSIIITGIFRFYIHIKGVIDDNRNKGIS